MISASFRFFTCTLLGASLLVLASSCTPRGPTLNEIAVVQDSYQVVELMGLTAVAVQDAIVSQGGGSPLLRSATESESSRLALVRAPIRFDFKERGEVVVDLAPSAFANVFTPTVRGALKAEFSAIGGDGYNVTDEAGKVIYDVTVTCTSACVYAAPTDGTTITLAPDTTYHFILHLDWKVFLPTYPFPREPQVAAPRWKLAALVELKGVQVAASGARTTGGSVTHGFATEHWTTIAHGERTASTVLEVADDRLEVSRTVVADWSLATTLNGVPHTLLIHRPSLDQATLTIDGITHGPYTRQELADGFGVGSVR